MSTLFRHLAGSARTSRGARTVAAGWYGAMLIGFVSSLVLAGLTYSAYRATGHAGFLAGMVGVVVLSAGWLAFAGGVADLAGQHARDLDAKDLLDRLRHGEAPRRPFTLYLRPFAATNEIDDEVLQPIAAGMPMLSFAFAPARYELEQQIERATRDVGPLVALGEPLEHVGAGRVRVTDDTWQDAVRLLTRHAALIVLLPSARPGTLWEIEHILDTGLVERTVMIDPPNLSRKGDRYHQENEWTKVRAAFAARGYEIAPDSRVGRLVFFGAERTPRATARLNMDAEDNIAAFFRKVLTRRGGKVLVKQDTGVTPA
jgi:hypothetical protein